MNQPLPLRLLDTFCCNAAMSKWSSIRHLFIIPVLVTIYLLIVTTKLTKHDEYANARKQTTVQSKKQNDEEQIKGRLPSVSQPSQLAVQAERQRILRQGCVKYPELSHGDLSWKTKSQILVSEKHKLLYCFIPKVGCSNWKRVMMKLEGNTNKDLLNITSSEAHNNHRLKTLNNYNKDQQKMLLTSFTKFIFVRNPFVRILSTFKNKFENIERYRKRSFIHRFGKEMIRKYRKHATREALYTGENATWDEFVRYVTDPAGNVVEVHWEAMNILCSPCKVKYNFLGRLESIETDAQFMLQELNLSDQIQYPSAKRSHPTNSTASFEKMFRKLNEEQLEILWDIYKKDFELFGYPKPEFL